MALGPWGQLIVATVGPRGSMFRTSYTMSWIDARWAVIKGVPETYLARCAMYIVVGLWGVAHRASKVSHELGCVQR